jgi:hypothetical protein
VDLIVISAYSVIHLTKELIIKDYANVLMDILMMKSILNASLVTTVVKNVLDQIQQTAQLVNSLRLEFFQMENVFVKLKRTTKGNKIAMIAIEHVKHARDSIILSVFLVTQLTFVFLTTICAIASTHIVMME